MFIPRLKAIVDITICNSFFVIAARRIDVVFARTEIRRPLIRARFAKRISSLCPISIEIKDTDMYYEVTRSDMKALQKLEEMESIVEE